MSEEFVLYDLPSKNGKAWSPNTWKVRLVLNYKKLPYKTEWIEFPDIPAKCKELGIPQNPAGSFKDYTVPILRFPDGSYVMDSIAIVNKLESLHPEPSLRFDWDLQKELDAINGKILGPLMPLIFPCVRREIVPEVSETWFKEDRERMLGAPEEQYERERGGETAWKAAEPALQQLATFLKSQKRDDGPFIRGSQVCYTDFTLVGRCELFGQMGTGDYERLVGPVPELREIHEACKPWLERNEH